VDDESKEKKDKGVFYIQETLQGKDVVLIDISQKRSSIYPDKMISVHYLKGKYYIKEKENR